MVRIATDPAAKKGKKQHIQPSPTKKKKGRPSKADLARRYQEAGLPRRCQETGLPRRSQRTIRRRRMEEDYGEYFDSDSEAEAEAAVAAVAVAAAAEAKRKKKREKKLKLVLKFPPIESHSKRQQQQRRPYHLGGGGGAHGRTGSESSYSGLSAEPSEEDEKPLKKRRISGRDEDDSDEDDYVRDGDGDGDGDAAAAADDDGEEENAFGDDDDDYDDDDGDVRSSRSDDENEEKENEVRKSMDSIPASPADYYTGTTPLPDKKTLDFILHKLQKKDIYGVYAEPVDPKELPDYHDIIEHPMDFGTVKKKLARGAYSSLEQLETDIFLICTNAMQYNAPETIYYKQARSIQELARKRFGKIRIHALAQEELKSEQKNRANSVAKSVKKPAGRTSQEPVGSDFSSGATLAATGEGCTVSKTIQTGVCEKQGNGDGLSTEGNSFLAEEKPEKGDEFSVKGFALKFGKKKFVVDENRRATYGESDQPTARVESVFSTFENETKQLVAVGLHADHSYARSLARFAATLGPVAWRIASKRIEQALPVGYKFGRGWVGEYEPPRTPILLLRKQHMCINISEDISLKNGFQSRNDGKMEEKVRTAGDTSPKNVQLGLMTPRVEAISSKRSIPPNEVTCSAATSERRPVWSAVTARNKSVGSITQQAQRNSLNMDLAATNSEANVVKELEVNRSSSMSTAPVKTASQRTELVSDLTSRAQETTLSNRNPVWIQQSTMGTHANNRSSQAGISNTSINGGVVAGSLLPNGKAPGISSVVNGAGASPMNFTSNIHVGAPSYLVPGNQDQGLTDPVQLMRMLSGKLPNQPNTANSSVGPQVLLPFTSSRREEQAAATAARAWMSVGSPELKPASIRAPPEMQIAAASLFNPTRELPNAVFRPHADASGSVGLPQAEKNRFSSQSLWQPVHTVSEELRFQNNRSNVFPHASATELSRFQMQSPWRGLAPHTQQRQKIDMRPPDLNIGFQSPGSPVQQSPRVRVDSQQPDLALQL